jgi:hypothetical protein
MKNSQTFVIFLMLFLSACSRQTAQISEADESIVKVITTRAYTARNEFDKIVKDKPTTNMGYDESLGMDFGWSTKHFDRHGNVVYQEYFFQDETQKEVVFRKVTKKFYAPKEGKLEFAKAEGTGGEVTEQQYVRANDGRLEELRTIVKDELEEKSLHSYNSFGQRITIETFKQGGISEKKTYLYESTEFTATPISEIQEVYGDPNYRIEFSYERDESGRLVRLMKKYLESGQLKSDYTTSYSDYDGDIATTVIKEGYDSPSEWADENGGVQKNPPYHYRKAVSIKLNENRDIVEYKANIEPLQLHVEDKFTPGYVQQLYVCEYTYNDRQEWIELVFSPDRKTKYIVSREIKYLDQ